MFSHDHYQQDPLAGRNLVKKRKYLQLHGSVMHQSKVIFKAEECALGTCTKRRIAPEIETLGQLGIQVALPQ